MIVKATNVDVQVRDQEKALKFYTGTLGFEKRGDYPGPTGVRWLTVAPKGQDLEFALVKGEPAKGMRIVFQTDDCRKDVAALQEQGVKFLGQAPREQPYGVEAHFTDPDGNHLVLLQQAWKK
jgi:predicted enzyme related to lactoylglutathione lyase